MDPPGRIGKYEVLERIGAGGYGDAYLAREPLTERLVVLKVCTSEDETLHRRFLREAEIAGSLHHRNVATVYSSDRDPAGPYLVQEHLEGERLEAALRRAEPVDGPARAARLKQLLQVARALDYAHKKGVPHRDLGPESVQVLPDGRVKVLGFGIGKLAGAETGLARTGALEARAAYLAPEQITGEAVDERADLFAFGVLAYELLSGVHPFPGTTSEELQRRVIGEDPAPLTTLWPECPAEVAAVVAGCLEKDPWRRGSGFSEIAERLAEAAARLEAKPGAGAAPSPPAAPPEATLLSLPPVPRRPPLRLSPRARRAILAAAVLLASAVVSAGVVLLGWRLWPRPAPAASPVAAGAPAGAPAPGAEATLKIDAVPWGEVAHLTDDSGRSLPLPAERTTPLSLHLEPGEYLVELANPASEEPRLCRVTLEAGGVQSCRVEFYLLEPAEYFREAGWWK